MDPGNTENKTSELYNCDPVECVFSLMDCGSVVDDLRENRVKNDK